ncbi:hypothetical protein [Sporolactobacillus sp. KGMB 08714]|uniref:hypothetical protein n=1 Tax=Sporolactobacillus sp. KGMB 08714 TaxID=3064704 RepID=UPI002FBD71F5
MDFSKEREVIVKALGQVKMLNEVTELRIMNTNKGTVSGYFNQLDDLAQNAIQNAKNAPGVYFTLNPVKKELLARASNHVLQWSKHTTTDDDIECRRWVPLDFDPVRPAGISSTDTEHEEAMVLAGKVKAYLTGLGFPAPIQADSGNGAHLLYRIDLPNNDESRELVKDILEALDSLFSNNKVKIDTSVYNAARIWKLYGTVARKGDNTPDRPHRYAKVLKVPSPLETVSEKLLKSSVGKKESLISSSKLKGPVSNQKIDVEAWLQKHGIEIARSEPWNNGSTKYVLKTCPWNSDHTDKAAYVIQFPTGLIKAGCHHDSCSNETWRTLWNKYEPGSISSTISGKPEKMSQADELVLIGSEAEYYLDTESKEVFACFENQRHYETWNLRSLEFQQWLRYLYHRKFKKTAKTEAINQASLYFESQAMYEGNGHYQTINLRAAKSPDGYCYDLTNAKWDKIKITASGCARLNTDAPLFFRSSSAKAQPDPLFPGDVRLLLNHVHLRNQQDEILLLVYLITCLIPDISHVVLVLNGEKGAAKSTTMRMLKKIIDPSKIELLVLPKTIDNLAVTLTQNYMPCFDNLGALTKEQSNLLCVASTGGGISKRRLYTDADDVVLDIKRCVALNGCNCQLKNPPHSH